MMTLFLFAVLAATCAALKWLFQAPGWAGESRNARSLCRGFQIGSAIALTGFVSSGAGVFLQI